MIFHNLISASKVALSNFLNYDCKDNKIIHFKQDCLKQSCLKWIFFHDIALNLLKNKGMQMVFRRKVLLLQI